MKTSYREWDYTYGATMLTLRTAIGLTQEGLARYLGVSRRAVGEWEAGSSYPKAEHLKALIALGVEQQAFREGHEAEEIRALWKAAHQKVLLDERWLSTLLSHAHAPHLHLVPPPAVQEAVGTGLVPSLQVQGACPVPQPRVDWDDAPVVPLFYGREQEQAKLTQWVVQERCRVVSVLGMGGTGKSALTVHLMYQLAEHFEVVIFRSLSSAPALEALLAECLQVLDGQAQGTVPTEQALCAQPQGEVLTGQAQGTIPTEQWLSRFLSYLRQVRALVVLDNLECLLDTRGHFCPGFLGYGVLLRRVAETMHQSCLLLTSREAPADLRPLEGKSSPVRSLRLTGLDDVAGKQLLVEKEVVGTEAERERLIEAYSGNPQALKIVAATIVDLFGEEIGLFLAKKTLIFGGIADLLGEQLVRLGAVEKAVLCSLAIDDEPMTLDELLAFPLPRMQVLEAVDGLHRRCLIEHGNRAGSFTLQVVVREYVTTVLREEVL